MESQIYDGHKTKEPCKQQNLGKRIDHSDESDYVKIRRSSFDKSQDERLSNFKLLNA